MNKDAIILKTVGLNFVIAFFAVIFGWLFGGPKIFIEFKTALFIAIFLAAISLVVIIWSIIFLYKVEKKQGIVKTGPYSYVRYPIVSATIFLLNPALAILFRSWLWLIAVVLIYYLWANAVKNEEVFIVKEIGNKYRNYRRQTPALFPKISHLKFIFYPAVGLLVFLVIFISLNFSSYYLHYVEWRPKKQMVESLIPQMPSIPAQNLNQAADIKPVIKYDKPNSVVISKIGVDAPLVGVHSTDQKTINQALNNGVVVYPGSKRPDEIGNFFITGHSSTYPWNKTPYGQVFALIDKLQPGDIVIIYYNQIKYEYKITNKYIKGPKDVWLVHLKDKSVISLMTCWPIGTNLKRLIVEGELVK